jgi:hypothetical protein
MLPSPLSIPDISDLLRDGFNETVAIFANIIPLEKGKITFENDRGVLR